MLIPKIARYGVLKIPIFSMNILCSEVGIWCGVSFWHVIGLSLVKLNVEQYPVDYFCL
jgi:hypothetical protein